MNKQETEWIFLFAVIAVGAWVCLGFVRVLLMTRRLRRLAVSRSAVKDQLRTEFIAYCVDHGLPLEVAEKGYEYLAGITPGQIGGFPIGLNDHIYRVLNFDRGEIDTIAEDLAGVCMCKVQWDSGAAEIKEPRVRDLLDLILRWRGLKSA